MESIFHQLTMTQMQIGRMRHRVIDSAIRELGVHPGQHLMLVELMRLGKLPSQARLAEEMGVSPALVTRTLNNLEASGYIARADSAADGRRNEITITEKGAQALQMGKCIVDDIDKHSFDGFSPEELESFRTLLGKLYINLSRMARAEKEIKEKEMKEN